MYIHKYAFAHKYTHGPAVRNDLVDIWIAIFQKMYLSAFLNTFTDSSSSTSYF